MTSEFAYPVSHNPNASGSECPVTKMLERGVTFPNADPFGFEEVLFLGETAVVEAFGVLFDLTPKQVHKLVEVHAENKALKAELKKAQDDLKKWAEWRDRAEDLGVMVSVI